MIVYRKIKQPTCLSKQGTEPLRAQDKKTIRFLFHLAVTVLLFCFFIFTCIQPAYAEGSGGGGSGGEPVCSGAWTDDGNYTEPAYDEETSTYTIDNAAELAWVAVQVNGGKNFSGYTISLTDNINLAAHYWVPIGSSTRFFTGTFDGNGNVISYLTIGSSANPDSAHTYTGLFGQFQNSEVKDLKLTHVSIDINYSGYTSLYIGGLAGYMDGSTVTNCDVEGTISGISGYYNYIGGLIGYVNGINTISECGTAMDLTCGSNAVAGGLLGYCHDSDINICCASGDITGGTIGGLISDSSVNTINDCYATGNLTGMGRIGGLLSASDNDRIADCYAAGDVEYNGTWDFPNVGGFIGYASNDTISDVFWNSDAKQIVNGTAQSEEAKVGIGYCRLGTVSTNAETENDMQSVDFVDILNGCAVGNMAWIADTDMKNNGFPVFDSAGGDKLTQTAPMGLAGVMPTSVANDDGMITSVTTEMEYKLLNAITWNKVTDTEITGLKPGTYLVRYAAKAEYYTSPSVEVMVPEFTIIYWTDKGNYSASVPDLDGTTYTIDNAAELAWVAYQVNNGKTFEGETVELSNDIDLSDHYWKPIGSNDLKVFKGVFNGNGKVVSNVKIGQTDNPNTDLMHAGFFGYTDGAEIKNLGLTGITFYTKTASYIGGLAGELINSTVTDCYAEGDIFSGGDVGILAGKINNTTVTSCYTEGNITADAGGEIGGLVGFVYGNNRVTGCHADVEITGDGLAEAGGLIGESYGSDIYVCYATGDVTGGVVGGLIGYTYNDFIRDCYATGDLTGLTNYHGVGGFAGRTWNDMIADCYATGDTTCTAKDLTSESPLNASSIQVGGFIGNAKNTSICDGYWNYYAS